MYDILELNKKLVSELREIAKQLKIKRVEALRKQDLIYRILDQQAIVASDIPAKQKEHKKDRSSLEGRDKAPRRRGRKPAAAKEEKPQEPISKTQDREVTERVPEKAPESDYKSRDKRQYYAFTYTL